jgi:hypothetical protein
MVITTCSLTWKSFFRSFFLFALEVMVTQPQSRYLL